MHASHPQEKDKLFLKHQRWQEAHYLLDLYPVTKGKLKSVSFNPSHKCNDHPDIVTLSLTHIIIIFYLHIYYDTCNSGKFFLTCFPPSFGYKVHNYTLPGMLWVVWYIVNLGSSSVSSHLTDLKHTDTHAFWSPNSVMGWIVFRRTLNPLTQFFLL